MSGFLCAMVGATFSVAAAAEILRSKKGVTAVGNAQIDTAQSKFGGASALFDGFGDRLVINPDGSFAYTGDFTIEAWVRPATFANAAVLFSQGSAESNMISIYCAQYTGQLIYYAYSSNRITGSNVSTNTWHHIAVSREGSSIKLFLNGTQVGSTYTDTTSIASNTFNVGTWINDSSTWNGHIDEIRISKTARYTTTFTPSTTPFVNDDNTLLLIHADGTDATTFFEDDNGSRASNGLYRQNTAAISTTQSKFGGTSISLNGSSSVNTPTAFAFGTGDFTVEYWVRPTTLSGYDIHWDLRGSNTSQVSPIVYTNGTTLYMDVGATTRITGSTLSTGTWYHIALSRASGSTKLFVNGTQVGSTYTDTNNYLAATPLYIGMSQSGSGVDGYMDEFRISNSARYTANFTAPITQFVNDANTLLLVHADGTDGSTVFRDDNGIQGAAPKTLAASGNAQLSTAQYKFGTSSLLLDGNGDYLTVTNAHDLNFQKNDFTIEAWVRFDALATSNRHTLISNGVSSFTTGWIKFAAADLGAAYYPQVTAYDYSSGGSPMLTSSTAVSNNTWYHIAWVRSSTNHYLYLDGVQVASATNSTAQGINVNMNLSGTQIGRYGFDNGTPPSATYMDGYIDEMRISNVARYTGAFTPSTTAFTPDANTLFLSHFEGANASTTILDSGGRTQKGVSKIANAQVDTAQSKFGGSSLYFPAADDYLLSPAGDWSFPGDFTVECWVRGTSFGSYNAWATSYQSSSGWYFALWNDNSMRVYIGGSNVLTGTSTFNTNTWYHIAIVRSGSTMTYYKDGVSIASATVSGNISSSVPLAIGTNYDYILHGWTGHMDEFRISNSARYTTTFTPSTTPFQNDDNTVLLLHMDGTDASTAFFDDNGAKPYTP